MVETRRQQIANAASGRLRNGHGSSACRYLDPFHAQWHRRLVPPPRRARPGRHRRPTARSVDRRRSVLTPDDDPFTIDAHPFRGDDGQWYLYYARDFLDGDRPGTALMVDRMLDPLTLAGERRTVLRASADWQILKRERPIDQGGMGRLRSAAPRMAASGKWSPAHRLDRR